MNALNHVLGNVKFHGLLGETLDFLRDRGPIIANFAHTMAMFGTSLGRCPHVFWEKKRYPNMNWVLVGTTGSGKGRSLDAVTEVFNLDRRVQYLLAPMSHGSFTSGVRLIQHIHNYIMGFEEGESRFLAIIPEFESTLSCMRISTNKLNGYLINLHDYKDIREVIGKKHIDLTGLHFGMVGHITPYLLHDRIPEGTVKGGLGSRLFFLHLPEAKYSDGERDFNRNDLLSLQGKIKTSLEKGGERTLVKLASPAKKLFREFDKANFNYAPGDPTIKNLTIRFGIQCIKMALMISLFNGESQISLDSLKSALSVVEYSKATILHLFSGTSKATPQFLIKEFIAQKGSATKTEITERFAHTFSNDEISNTLIYLEEHGHISVSMSQEARGRKKMTYTSITSAAA